MNATLRIPTRAPWTRGLTGRVLGALALACLLFSSTACVTNPVTGRVSFNTLDRSDDVKLGKQAYGQLLAEATFITSGPEYDMVQEVVGRLVEVADYRDEFEWEVKLVDDDTVVNAWCLPGGKMAVYTGILPFTQDATGLAVVMGHEIGHAISRHGTERMTHQMGTEALLAYVDGELGPDARAIGEVFATGLFLPWGRKQELESDHVGLLYMAEAGYDPDAAVGFWQRMAADKEEGSMIDGFLSTHPSDQVRIEQIEDLLPKARRIYGRSRAQP